MISSFLCWHEYARFKEAYPLIALFKFFRPALTEPIMDSDIMPFNQPGEEINGSLTPRDQVKALNASERIKKKTASKMKNGPSAQVGPFLYCAKSKKIII
jgi:hypothetical protein